MTLQELQDKRALVYAAYQQALKSQEYRVSDGVMNRMNRRADFEQLRLELADLDRQIAAMSPTRTGVIYLR